MKRILALMLTVAMALAAVSGCTVPEEGSVTLTIAETASDHAPFEYKDGKPYCFYAHDADGKLYRVLWTDFEDLNEKDHITVQHNGIIKTLTHDEYPYGNWTSGCEITANGVQPCEIAPCISAAGEAYVLTLPKSGKKIELNAEQSAFVPYITDALVEAAENNITEDISWYTGHPDIYLNIAEDYLCLGAGAVVYVCRMDPLGQPDKSSGGTNYKHIYYSERISSRAIKNNEKPVFGIGDPAYGMIQFFPQPILEFEEYSYDTEAFEWAKLTESDMDLLRQIYNDGKGWENDAVVDRESFYFDGRIRFATEDSQGWMYFGLDQGVLYYDGRFTKIDFKVMDIIERARNVRNKGVGSSQENKYLVDHIQIRSGDNAVHPFGCFLQSRIDNGDGTFTESMASGQSVIDLVSGKTNVSVENIPKLALSDDLSYSIQANGKVEKVYLLTPSGDGYTKTETTFEALSDLSDGMYYVVLEVLLGGNCDPDTPQHTYRYEDVFGLVVGDNASSDFILVSVGSAPSPRLLTDPDRQIILNILAGDREWSTETLECTWNCRFSGPSVNLRYSYGGTLFDKKNNRYCRLTDKETESIESLISRYTENP